MAEPGAAQPADKADFEKTMVLRPSAMRAVVEQAKAAAAAGGGAQPQAAEAARVAALQAVGTAAQASGIAEKPATAAPSAPPPPRPSQPLGAIQLISGASAGKELELTKPLTTLGKPGVQVAVLTRRPQGYFITHVEGANHPTVNGNAIGTAPHALKDHDLIELAGVKMEFFIKA
jgi:hypothetical protein